MGWYLRKSFGFGPLRLNLSKSGLGYSVGVPGARIGMNARGTYVRMGRGGIYYQKYLNTVSTTRPGNDVSMPPKMDVVAPELANVIQTANASTLKDSSASELLQEITSHYQKARVAPVVIVITAVATGAAMFMGLPKWIPVALVIIGALAHALATRADYRRKVVHLEYALEKDSRLAYVELLHGLEQLLALGGLWRVSSSEMNADTKYHAGAQYSVNRKSISAAFERPPFISTQAAAFLINTGIQRLYFMPDRLLIYEGDSVGAVSYLDLTATYSPVTFVESGRVPPDTEIIGKTWRYTNKNGGPDRRFSNNSEIPIVRYAGISLQSKSGLNYLMEASNIPKAQVFIGAITQYAASMTPRDSSHTLPSPSPTS